METTERVESRYYIRDDDTYVCGLYPHVCRLRPGQYERYGSRRMNENMLVAYSYGKVSSMGVDPIKKKPLYNYRPKSGVLLYEQHRLQHELQALSEIDDLHTIIGQKAHHSRVPR